VDRTTIGRRQSHPHSVSSSQSDKLIANIASAPMRHDTAIRIESVRTALARDASRPNPFMSMSSTREPPAGDGTMVAAPSVGIAAVRVEFSRHLDQGSSYQPRYPDRGSTCAPVLKRDRAISTWATDLPRAGMAIRQS